MRKAIPFIFTGLLICMLASSAMAAGSTALNGTTWSGPITLVSVDPDTHKLISATDNATLAFNDEIGEFVAAALSSLTEFATPVYFSGLKNGASLEMTAAGYLMSASMPGPPPPRKGLQAPRTMVIEGTNLQDGSMFKGTLTKQ